MKRLLKILVATDFGDAADDAVRMATNVAKTFGSDILLLHVVSVDWAIPIGMDMLKDKISKRLATIKTDIEATGARVSHAIVDSGVPFDKIIFHADRHDVNVIFVGSGMKTADDPIRLGITAERLIRKAFRPIWVVKSGASLEIKEILCPVDFSKSSGRALLNAVELARTHNAELTVLHAIQPWGSFNPAYMSLDDVASKAQMAYVDEEESFFDDFLRNIDWGDVIWKREVRQGPPHRVILEVARERRSDLIVMGTVGKTGLARILMGSVTEKVVRQMPCSIITVKSTNVVRP